MECGRLDSGMRLGGFHREYEQIAIRSLASIGVGARKEEVQISDDRQLTESGFVYKNRVYASVAQLDSASVFGTEGYRFESYRAYLEKQREIEFHTTRENVPGTEFGTESRWN